MTQKPFTKNFAFRTGRQTDKHPNLSACCSSLGCFTHYFAWRDSWIAVLVLMFLPVWFDWQTASLTVHLHRKLSASAENNCDSVGLSRDIKDTTTALSNFMYSVLPCHISIIHCHRMRNTFQCNGVLRRESAPLNISGNIESRDNIPILIHRVAVFIGL